MSDSLGHRRRRTVKLSALLAVAAVATILAQAPVSTELIRARRVHLVSDGVERRWLDKLADEFRKAKRFTLVATQDEADAIVTLRKGKGTAFAAPVVGVIVAGENDAFHLTITDPSGRTVWWDDAREAGLTIGSAITTLSKHLHEQLARADR